MKSDDGARLRHTKATSKSSQDNPRLSFFTGDFRKQLIGLRSNEVGVFTHLCLAFWDMGPLPSDLADLAVLCPGETERSFAKIWPKIQRKFLTTQDGLVVAWLAENKINQINYYEKQARNGRLGGRPRNPVVSSGLTQTETQTEPTEKPPFPDPSTEDLATNEDRGSSSDPSHRKDQKPAHANSQASTELINGHRPGAQSSAPLRSLKETEKRQSTLVRALFVAAKSTYHDRRFQLRGGAYDAAAAREDITRQAQRLIVEFELEIRDCDPLVRAAMDDAERAIIREQRKLRHA